MKLTIYGRDWLIVDENNIDQINEGSKKIHLIKLNFDYPTLDKVNKVLNKFSQTNRYIIDNNIKFYNDILKKFKKYYVMNKPGIGLLTHFKKNNKVLLNYHNLNAIEQNFVRDNLNDVLKNLEVIYLKRSLLEENWTEKLKYWNGNILVEK